MFHLRTSTWLNVTLWFYWDPIDDADLEVQIQKLGESLGTKGFFISRLFCDAMVGTFEYDKRIASRICNQNINLLSYTGRHKLYITNQSFWEWGWTRHQINAQNLEHVLKIGFVKLLPIQGADKSWILYISSSRCDLYVTKMNANNSVPHRWRSSILLKICRENKRTYW